MTEAGFRNPTWLCSRQTVEVAAALPPDVRHYRQLAGARLALQRFARYK
jgi:hypothetical protein